MPRIAGVDLPRRKRGAIALTYVFGLGRTRALEILVKADIDPNVHSDDWSEEQVQLVRQIVESDFVVEGMLRSEIQMNIKRLRDIGCYRGVRHRRGLPARGQRTKTNARTRKGRKKTVAGKKVAPRK